jgi:uncharacterized membrane protein (DUF373 family)
MAVSPDSADHSIRLRDEARRRRAHVPLLVVDQLEDLVHYLIAALLLMVAVYVVYKTADDFLSTHLVFAVRVTGAINGVLFVIIVLELLRTVLAHFETAELQLQPFLIIGIISAVRHILTIGARLTLQGEGTAEAFRHSQIELGVESGVVIGLAVALLLVRHNVSLDDG